MCCTTDLHLLDERKLAFVAAFARRRRAKRRLARFLNVCRHVLVLEQTITHQWGVIWFEAIKNYGKKIDTSHSTYSVAKKASPFPSSSHIDPSVFLMYAAPSTPVSLLKYLCKSSYYSPNFIFCNKINSNDKIC